MHRTVKRLLGIVLFLGGSAWGSISHVTDCTPAATTSCTLAASVQYGDLLVSSAYRSNSNTPPTAASGWTTIQGSTGANTNSMRVSYKFAVGTETTCGTWTNATQTMCSVYRGVNIATANGPIGGSTASGSSSTTISYGTVTMSVSDGTSWVVGFGGAVSATNNDACPATVLTSLRSGTSITNIATCDTNAGVSSFTAKTLSISPTGGWRTVTLELLAAPAMTAPTTLVQTIHSGHTGISGTVFKIPVDSTLASNLLVLTVSGCGITTSSCDTAAPAITSVTDNQSQTWTASAASITGVDNYRTVTYYKAGSTAGVTLITVTWAGATGDFQYDYSQFNGIATSTPVDGTAVGAISSGPGGTAAANVSAGSITTTQTGDLLYSYCMYVSNNIGTNVASGIFIPAGSSFLSGDYSESSATQAFLQTGSGAIAPAFQILNTNTQNWACNSVAFKTSGGAGTAPGSGVHIVHMQYTWTSTSTAQKVLFPSSGNLLVKVTSEATGSNTFSSVTDTSSNSYTLITPASNGRLAYTCNATTSNTLIQTVNTGITSQWWMDYDVANAATSCADTSASTTGTQSGTNANITSAPSITPTTSNGIVFAQLGVGTGPPSGVINTAAGDQYDCLFYTGEDDTDKTCNGDGWAHRYNANTSAEAWGWTMANGPASSWEAFAASFKGVAAPAGGVDSSNGAIIF